MKSLENLKDVLGDIEINEEQTKALDSFFEDLYESLLEKAKEELLSNNEFISIEEAEAAFDLAMGDAEAAFEMAMNDAEAAFELFESDIIDEHSNSMTKALEDLYESLVEKAKEEVIQSPQFESLNKIKEILTPFIIEESNSESLLKENRKLKEAIRFVSEEKQNLERKEIIESLINELPSKEKNVIRNYINEAKSIEEIYERYNLAISLFEAKNEEEEEELEDQVDVVEESEEGEIKDEELEEDEEVQAESIIYSESKIESKKEKPKRFSSIEEAIISTVFK